MPEHRPLRVLVVTTALVPDQLHTWEAASRRPGIDLHVAGSLAPDSSESYLAPVAVPDWGTIHQLEPGGLVQRGRLWWQLRGLPELIARLRPDVVHVHSEVWGRLVAQALGHGAPVVAHGAENLSLVHGGTLEGKIRRTMAVRNARRLAGYASWNQAGVAILRANGLPAGAPTVVGPAIVPDPARFLAVERKPDAPGSVRVGYVGRLVPEKGVGWLLDALDGIAHTSLMIAGSGPYEPELRRQAARRDVEVEWRGAVDATEVSKVYADMDIVVVPSLTRPGWAEQFGRVVCEAMLTGAAVVSSDSGSLPEVVGTGGIVVPESDRGALSRVLADLVADDAARRSLGEQGRAWALDQLVPAVVAGRLEDFWRKVARP